MSSPEVFRPRSGYVLFGIVAVMSAMTAGPSVPTYGLEGALPALLIAATVTYAAYLVFVRPKVVMDDDAISIVNPTSSARVGWRRVDAIEARYTMFLEAEGRTIHAWAAPAPGRYHSRTVHPSELRGLAVSTGRMLRPGESPRTHSGAAVYLARQRWQAARDRVSPASTAELTARVDWLPVVLLTGGLLLSVASVLHA